MTPEENQDSRPAEARSGWRRLRFPHSWAEVKQLGWKMIAAFVLFYLVRDAVLYVLLPYLAYKGIVD